MSTQRAIELNAPADAQSYFCCNILFLSQCVSSLTVTIILQVNKKSYNVTHCMETLKEELISLQVHTSHGHLLHQGIHNH